MRVFLVKSSTPDRIHGVDYHKGLEDGRECGIAHEFHTRNCRPIFVTDEEESFSTYKPEELVEAVPFRVT